MSLAACIVFLNSYQDINMTYETLDKIADSYIPLLLIIFLLGLIYRIYLVWPTFKSVGRVFGFAVVLILICYGCMFADKAMHIWPSLGLDYSTHTAASLSLVFALCVLFPRAWKFLVLSFIAYAILMLYQRYHSFTDIFTTTVVISILSFLVYKLLFSAGKDNQLASQSRDAA